MPIATWASQHRIWMVGAGILSLAAIVAVVGAGIWFFILRSPATRVDLSQALRQYRLEQRGKQRGANTLIPPAGVYRYRTTGSEHLSFGGISRAFPTASDMIVTDSAGCATLQWEPFEQHIEGLVECAANHGKIDVHSALSYEQIAGTKTTSVISCPANTYFLPPDPTLGEKWHTTCHATGERIELVGQVLNYARVKVDGKSMPAIHTRISMSFSGAEHGVNPTDYWVSTSDGVILRRARNGRRQPGPGAPWHGALWRDNVHRPRFGLAQSLATRRFSRTWARQQARSGASRRAKGRQTWRRRYAEPRG